MGISLVLATLLVTSCSGAGVVRRKGPHYDYLGRQIKTSDEDPKVMTDARTSHSTPVHVGEIKSEGHALAHGPSEDRAHGVIKERSGPHYDYLGRLKTSGEDPKASTDAGHSKSGPHYDYLGRLKTEKTSAEDPKAVTVSATVSKEATVSATAGTVSATVSKEATVSATGTVGKEVHAQPSNVASKAQAEDSKMSTGFSNAEDLPTTDNPKQVTMESSKPPKAGASGPSFHSEDNNSEHPNVVDKVEDVRQYSTEKQEESSSFSSLLFWACPVGLVAWIYSLRGQAKDKANETMGVVGPLVNEAMGVMGTVKDSAYGHVKHASFHTRLFQEPSWHYHKVGSNADDDLIQEHCHPVADDDAPYGRSAAFMEDSYHYTDEPTEVPTLVEQKPPADLLEVPAPAPMNCDLIDTAPPPPMSFDPFADDACAPSRSSQPQTLDTCGFDL